MKSYRADVPTKAQKRFTKIYELLARGGSYKAKELAAQFFCDPKTITNDLKPLIEHGTVVYKAHYYSMPEEHRNTQILEEANMAASMMHTMFKKAIPQMSDDVNEIFKSPAKNSDVFYFDFLLESISDEALIANIVNAINTKMAISFEYTARNGTHDTKTVYPLKIANYYGNWYLLAYDLAKDKIRTYHLKEITSFQAHTENYLSHDKRNALELQADKIYSPWYNESPQKVILHVEGLAITYIKRKQYPHIKIVLETEEMLELEMLYYQPIEVMNFVKQWLPFVSIPKDERLQKILKEILQTALEKL